MSGKGKSGPTIGTSRAPLVAAVGSDRVLFSKKLLFVIGLVVLVSGFIFFSVEESTKAGLLRKSRIALAQNNAIQAANDKLEEAQALLQKEEDSLVDMYTQWLDEDHDTLELTEKQLAELKEQLKAVKEQLDEHGEVIDDKEASLEEKEQRLKAYQFKIQQKSDYLQQMAEVLAKLNMTKPEGLGFGESPEEYIWDEDPSDDDAYAEQYTGDDDWMSDEEWY